MRFRILCAAAALVWAVDARAQDNSPAPPAESAPPAPSDTDGPPAAEPAPAPPEAAKDPASTPPPQPKPALPEEELRTRLSGSLRTEIFLTQHQRLRPAGDGRFALQATKVFPFYETIRLRADDIGVRGLSVHFQGWAGLDMAEIFFDKRFVADPTYLYLQYKNFGLDLKLGRQMIFNGATRGLHLDGLYASYETPVHLGIEGFGGFVVSPKIGPDWYREQPSGLSDQAFGAGYSAWKRPGDYAVGGRLFFRLATRVSAGVSILNVMDMSEVDRRLVGADLDLTPVRWLSVTGNAALDLMTARLQEATAAVDIFPIEQLSIGADYRHSDPTLFLSHMSIFSVFSDETYDAVGGVARGRPVDWLELFASFHQRFYGYADAITTPEGDRSYEAARATGFDVGGGLRARYGRNRDGFVRAEYSRTTESTRGIHEVRLGAIVPLGVEGLRATADLYLDFFDEAWNAPYDRGASSDSRFGILGDLGVFYGNGTVEAGGSISQSSTPYARYETRGMLKFNYNFQIDFFDRRRP